MSRTTILTSSEADAERRRDTGRTIRDILSRVPEKYQHCTLDNFDPTHDADALREARRYVDACAGWFDAGKPTRNAPSVFFTSVRWVQGDGPEKRRAVIAPGNGKTHLAVGIIRELAERGYGRVYRHERSPSEMWPNLVFVSSTAFLDEVRTCYRRDSPKTVEEVIGRYVNADVLIFDDVGTEDENADAMQKLFMLLEKRTRPTIYTSNYRASQLEKRPNPEWAKLVSRMRTGMIAVMLTGPDRRPPDGDPWKEWTK